MRNEALSDVLKVWLYAAASVMLGAWISPLFYNGGKALAEVSSAKQTNGVLEWLADHCRMANFPTFFVLSLIFGGLVLFLPFAGWLHGGRGKNGSAERLDGGRPTETGQRLLKNPGAIRHCVRGFLVVTMLFLLLGGILMAAGIFDWRQPPTGGVKWIVRAALLAFGLAGLQEFLFRGVVMGIFLRAMRPSAALGLSAVLFALVYFLIPPPGLNVADPDAAGVGFELLRKMIGLFSEPRMIFGSFVPLLALGCVLAFARWRTASLWLSIGLNAGWIFINGIMGVVTVAVSPPGSMMWVLAGASLRQGLVPLAGILIAGIMIDYLTASDPDAAAAPL
ncbi:MAG: CPBP family intramembrane glutamic endopeptidase [Luteolibacter sp.]